MKKRTVRRSSALKKTSVCSLSLITGLVLSVFASCSDRNHLIPQPETKGIPITFNVNKLEQVPFGEVLQTRALNGEICNAISFAVYTMSNGAYTRVYNSDQKTGDALFGSATFNLEEGGYYVLVIAHNGDTSPTTTNPARIEFNKNKVTTKMTDTFIYWSAITVDESTTSFCLDLTRQVAMFQLNLTDNELPDNVSQLKFYYQGGSSTLDATTGYGCVASKQTEIIDVNPEKKTYEVYTFLRDNSEKLEMTVSALNSAGTVIKEMKFTDVPITRNYKTRYTGEMFGKKVVEGSVDINLNGEWMLRDEVTF